VVQMDSEVASSVAVRSERAPSVLYHIFLRNLTGRSVWLCVGSPCWANYGGFNPLDWFGHRRANSVAL